MGVIVLVLMVIQPGGMDAAGVVVFGEEEILVVIKINLFGIVPAVIIVSGEQFGSGKNKQL